METGLLNFIENIINNMELKRHTSMTCLNLSATFDHNILLDTLKDHYGLQDSVLNLIKSYHTERQFTVIKGSSASDLQTINLFSNVVFLGLLYLSAIPADYTAFFLTNLVYNCQGMQKITHSWDSH